MAYIIFLNAGILSQDFAGNPTGLSFDAAMLAWAGHGVAMGNASAEALDMADEVIGTHTADGVAIVLEALIADYVDDGDVHLGSDPK